MPYKSNAQRRFFNSETGRREIGEKEVNKWNKESKGLKLPEKVGKDAIPRTKKSAVYIATYKGAKLYMLHDKKTGVKYYIPQDNHGNSFGMGAHSLNDLKKLIDQYEKEKRYIFKDSQSGEMKLPKKVGDAVNGSVQDFLNMMQGKNQAQVEQIIKKAKGNPNADEAYRKWKKQNIKDAMFKKGEIYKNSHGSIVRIDYYDKYGDVQYTHNKQSQSASEKGLKNMLVANGYQKVKDAAGNMYSLWVNGKVIKAFQSVGAPVKEAKEYMKKNNIKGVGTLVSNRNNAKFTITADTEPEYDPITKTLKVKTLGTKDATVFVDESDYKLSHHKNPSGRGMWIFGIGSKDMSAWKEFYGTYAEAKNQAKKAAAERNIKTIYTMG